MAAKMKKKKSGLRVALTVLSVILGILLAVLLAATVWAESLMGQINRTPDAEPTLSDEEIESILNETDAIDENYTGEILDEDIVLSDGAADLIEDSDDIINILLIGQDRRPGEGRQRSDSMILCTINLEEKTLVMTSFLRDLYVEIPSWNGKNYSNNRLNVNYVFGGMDMLDACLEQNFGVTVDHNVEVDFSGFESIVDAMGGVDINLTSAEAKWIGGGLTAGVNHLDGAQALSYSRIRKLDSDFGRTNRQRTVLNALLEKAKRMSLTEVNALINSFVPMITTDMDNNDITKYVAKIFPVLPQLQVSTQHIPADGTYRNAMIRGMAVLVPDMEANRVLLKETLS